MFDINKLIIKELYYLGFAPFYTKHNKYLKREGVSIGDYTYGRPRVLFWDSGAKLQIGKFVSISKNVKIYLGGNHRTDWISTYPFSALPFWNMGHVQGHPATSGNVIIGNDVWIGMNVTILSGVKIGDGAVIA